MSGIKGMNTGKQNIHYVHGETKTRLHRIWGCMHERCERVKHPHYDAYGGRGINVCDEWKEYLPFAEWARNNGYTDELTIDRIDVNGNYEPTNCRWVTMKEQHNNKRNNRILLYHGETYTLTQLSEKTGINKTTLKERLNLGWSIEDAVNRPVRQRTRGYRPSGAKMIEPQESEDEEGEQPKIIKCPNCGNVQFADKEWCPDCGCRMVEPQESEGI